MMRQASLLGIYRLFDLPHHDTDREEEKETREENGKENKQVDAGLVLKHKQITT